MSKNKLLALIYCLSSLVIVESVYIIGLVQPKPKLESSNPSLPKQLVAEMNKTAQKEALQFQIANSSTESARMWLTLNKDKSDQVDIWLEAPQALSFAQVKLKYDPQALTIIDQDPNQDGSQLAVGQAATYLQNQIDSTNGEIILNVQFESVYQPKILLASIVFRKIQPKNPSRIDFEFTQASQEGSYVLAIAGGGNILEKPEALNL
jgi:hypothetical protein